MSNRLYGLTAAILVCVVCVAVLPGVTQDQVPEDPNVLLTRRYAESYLKLAEIQLELLLDANKQSPRLIPETEINRARMNVTVAREQLRLVTLPDSDAVQLHLKHAQEAASIAEGEYQSALKAKAVVPSVYSDLLIRELQLKSEVAQLRLAIWSNPGTNVLSILDHMHWQLERVSEEVLDLQKRMDKLERRGG